MHKDFVPPVSVEEFAAYLDGNLTEDGMKHISSVISINQDLADIAEISESVDDTKELYMQDDEFLLSDVENMNYSIPVISDDTVVEQNVIYGEDTSTLGETEKYHHKLIDADAENNLYNKISTNQNNIEFMENTFDKDNEMQASIAAHKIFGEDGFGPDGGLNPVIYQGNEGVCAIRSQQIILRDYGIDISLDELKQYATENGWYDPSPEGGTPMWAIGNLLLSCNVPCEQSVDNTVYDLINELAQGHRVIVGVDANELWADRNHDTMAGVKEWFKDFFEGETPNHALVVAGVDVNPDNPDDIKVILTDPGTGDLRIEYKLDDFMDAWKDSQCFMVSTDTPAPLQYNPETGNEEPSNFAVAEYINTNSIPLNPNNVILPGEMAAKCVGAHYSEGHLDKINVDGEEVDYDDYAKSVETVHKCKSFINSSQTFGQDHFDAKEFCSALKSFLGMESDFYVPEGFDPNKQDFEDTPKPLVEDDDVTVFDKDEPEIEESKHELPPNDDDDLDDDNTEDADDANTDDDDNIFDNADLDS